jgi:GTP-binding protein HflX
MTEKTPLHFTLEEWKSTWMSRVGEENALFISRTNKENSKGSSGSAYMEAWCIPSPFSIQQVLYPDYKDMEKENKKRKKPNSFPKSKLH